MLQRCLLICVFRQHHLTCPDVTLTLGASFCATVSMQTATLLAQLMSSAPGVGLRHKLLHALLQIVSGASKHLLLTDLCEWRTQGL